EDAPGAPRRQPSGEGPRHRQGRDHLDESWLRRRPRDLAGERDRDARLAVRRLELRDRAQGQAGILGAVPSGGVARPARQSLSVRAFHRADAHQEARLARTSEMDAPRSTAGYGVVPAEVAGTISGLEFLQGMIAGRFPRPPIMELIGFGLVEVAQGRAVF